MDEENELTQAQTIRTNALDLAIASMRVVAIKLDKDAEETIERAALFEAYITNGKV